MAAQDYRKFYEGKPILVTGGAGAIGSNLMRGLGELGAKLVISWTICPRRRAGMCRALPTSCLWKAASWMKLS
jgi:NAD(P)-dependent dehydrogenase (short-subunit alcohol dehydrogenase family)